MWVEHQGQEQKCPDANKKGANIFVGQCVSSRIETCRCCAETRAGLRCAWQRIATCGAYAPTEPTASLRPALLVLPAGVRHLDGPGGRVGRVPRSAVRPYL